MKWSLERTIRLDGPNGGVGLIKPYIKQIDVVDPLTVKITLNMPDAVFLLRISSQIGASLIYSPKTTPADTFAKGVYAGTGPYKRPTGRSRSYSGCRPKKAAYASKVS